MSSHGPLITSEETIECEMHHDVEEEASITSLTPMRLHKLKNILFWLIVVLSGGLFYLISYWLPSLRIKFRYQKCQIDSATHVFAISKYFSDFTRLVQLNLQSSTFTVFYYQQLPYYYTGFKFAPLAFNSNLSCKELIDTYSQGVSEEAVKEQRERYGICLILVPVMPLFKMIVSEAFNPFYVFQVYSVLLWYFDDYEYYATAIVIITVISLTSSIVTTRKGQIALHELAKKECSVKVVRSGLVEIQSRELVPGDLVELDRAIELPCDLCLISGGCIVEEGMLTGESVPVMKDSISYLEDIKYDPDIDKRHTLYEGTKIIQTRNYSGNPVRAIVVRTGFKTAKGRLVRSIMYPKPNKFKFYEDSLKFIAVLALLTLVGFAITIPRMVYLEYDGSLLARRALDLITITVPPALPACMAAGTAFAISRLKKRRVFCISPNRVNVAGRIDLMVFDKTGTLTSDGMDLMGVQTVDEFNNMNDLSENIEGQSGIVECMACCHSLAMIDKKLMGDSQDLQIFKATNWVYEEPDSENYDPIVKAVVRPGGQSADPEIFNKNGQVLGMIQVSYELGVLHIFHFSSKLKRMGVVVKNLQTEQVLYYCKGAPEVIMEKCLKVPKNINSILSQYTRKGYRVLACAYKPLPKFKYTEISSLKIDDFEQDLHFIGLIVLQNKLKSETTQSLADLNQAGIITLMATGDAVLTGISVARECKMINCTVPIYLGELDGKEIIWELFLADEASKITKSTRPPWLDHQFSDEYVLALTGNAFSELVSREHTAEGEKSLKIALEKCRIYARMAPEHKTMLVEKLQNLSYLVGMCGDGANDCGALKSADIGISLSEADSSIAAPFTSQIADISCVITVLVEGRCALTTSIQCFKYMALYSMIQFTSVSFLYWYYGNLTDFQFLLFDLFTVLPLSILMSMTGPLGTLSVHQPPSELMSLRILSSVIIQALLQGFVQFFVFFVAVESYYSTPDVKPGDNPGLISYTNTIITLTSWAEYQIICAIFSIGKPWKKPSYSNIGLTVFQFALAFSLLFCIFFYDGTMRKVFDFVDLKEDFKLVLTVFILAYGVAAFCVERFLVPLIDNRWRKRKAKKIFDRKNTDLTFG